MFDIAGELHRRLAGDREFAVATVVSVSGSAPRGPGAALAVDSGGTVVGSVSGGCVEGAVYELCARALEDGATRVERFGYSDEDAFAVGLTCGGVIDIMVTPVLTRAPARPVLRAALSAAARGERGALVRLVEGPAELLGGALFVRPDGSYEGGLGGTAELDRTAAGEAGALLDAGRTGTVVVPAGGAWRGSARTAAGEGSSCPGGVTLFVESSGPPPRMIVFGAIDFAAALVRVGKFLGYHVTVCDARPLFVTRARFPEADEIVVDWPHRYLSGTRTDARTVLCVLTHDAKFDIPLLKVALELPVEFVGALGSRRTHADRERRLREAGVGERELSRLRSPIGLDLGARTPQETALSIAAEIVASRRGGTGAPLTGSDTPIHREARRAPAAA
ncbi:XdhC family protein [Streptomyces sp. CHD11]|uniref:XdhC family protein n=1 Tax=Streptomyces sp. CHD11 TaxID=2741325 RepID=UPI001BFC54A9|nr:XdhC/CoxI family protein [Streptomyces sp. CHD11]MBT3155047.1 XdhC family protein [Streptomyces sp. CHD11]